MEQTSTKSVFTSSPADPIIPPPKNTKILSSAKSLKSFALGLCAVLSVACASDGLDKETLGAVTGAVLGAAIGNQIGSGSGRTLATGAGLMLGALAGSQIGRRLHEKDRLAQAEATAAALDKDEQNEATWSSHDSSVTGTVEAGPIEADQQVNRQCRHVKQRVVLEDGTQMDEELEFCRVPDGPWERVV